MLKHDKCLYAVTTFPINVESTCERLFRTMIVQTACQTLDMSGGTTGLEKVPSAQDLP
jgi:hypothetical protein